MGAVPQALRSGARGDVSGRNAAPGTPLRPASLRRYVVALLLALCCAGFGGHPAQARTRLDLRIDTLTSSTLLTHNVAGLIDPGRQQRARKIADLRHAASAGWGLAHILAFWWLWRSGYGARVRDWMRRRTRSRLAQRAVFGALLGAIGPLAALPFSLVGYRVGFNAGVTDERLPQWFFDYALRIGLDALLGVLVVVCVLALVERVRLWYLVVMALFYGGALAGAALAPLMPFGPPHKTTPHVVAAVGAQVADLLGVAGTPIVVLASSHHSNAMTARAVGIGPTSRALLGDVTLDHMSPPEVRVVLAETLAHIRFADTLRRTLFAVTLFVLSAAVAVLLSDRVGFRRDDDALSRLPLVATFLGLVLLVTYPLYNAYERNVQTRADRATLAVVGDRTSVVRSMVRYADDDLVPLCDRRSIRWYFDDVPALGGRIAAAAGTADPCPGGGPATAGEIAAP